MFFLNNLRTAVQRENAMIRWKRVKISESLFKCQLTSCEKNQNTKCQSKYNKVLRPGWPVLRRVWHIEATPFKKIHDKLKKMKKATETKRKCPSFAKRALPSFPFPRIVEFPNSRDMCALRTYFLACSAGEVWRGEWIFSSGDQAAILN